MRRPILCIALVSSALLGSLLPAAEPADDPLAPILKPELKSSVSSLLDSYRRNRSYRVEDFPMPPERFDVFRSTIVDRLVQSLDLKDWAVRKPEGKQNRLQNLFRDRILKTIRHHGVTMEVHVIELIETGDQIPAVVCLPEGSGRGPAVAVFSGHSRHGLHDLVVNLESYQRGIAVRLAQAGFVTIAVEKMDTGYLSRESPSGVDEEPIATFRLGLRKLTRSVQLMASLAALEILAAHPRVDERRIGATGVSLGGWLSVQAALLSDRIQAVADFGRKTVYLPDEMSPAEFEGVRDLCHILPGTFELGDRNLLLLAYAPRPMLAGHGRKDKGSHEQAPRYYRNLFEEQYRALGREADYRYHIHEGGDTMPEQAVIGYFREQLGLGE